MADVPDPSDTSGHAPPHLDDLVAAIRAGDERAFELMYRTTAEELIDFGTGIVGDVALASDIVADVFIAIWDRRAAWSPPGGVRAYLFVSVRHRAINELRNIQRHDRVHDAMASADEALGMSAPMISMDQSLDLDAQVDVVFRALARLPEARRTAMTLRWQGELSVAEIAKIMGISVDAVKQHLSRGLRTLKQFLPDTLE